MADRFQVRHDLVAHVELANAAPQRSVLSDVIGDRTPTAALHVPGAPLDTLTGIVDVAGLAGVSAHWVTQGDAKAALGRLMIEAAMAITQDGQQSKDSIAWFRPSDQRRPTTPRRAHPGAQGMSPVMLTCGLPPGPAGQG
jgi:hypothetical protein